MYKGHLPFGKYTQTKRLGCFSTQALFLKNIYLCFASRKKKKYVAQPSKVIPIAAIKG